MSERRTRKILWIGVLLAAAFALFALVLFNLNKFIAINKDYLLGQVAQILGRQISAQSARISLANGIALHLENFAMSDDPAFSSDSFLRAGEVEIGLKLIPLLKREMQIKRLSFRDPQIIIIRNENGSFNFSSIGGAGEPTGAQSAAAERASTFATKRVRSAIISPLHISRGALRFADRKERFDLPLNQVDFSIRETLPGKRYFVELSAALLTDKPNLKMQAYIGPVEATMPLLDIPVDLQVTIDALDTGKLRASVARTPSYFPKVFDFGGVLSVKEMRFRGTLRELNAGAGLGGRPRHRRHG
jgi:uncharacterized protein involved in outer membrane biogenesis